MKKNEKKPARSFNFTFRYIYDVLSLNNSRFGDFIDRIYLIELEIKDNTDTAMTVSYIDLHLDLTVRTGKERNYFKRDDFSFPIVNTCIWSIYLSLDTLFQSMWILSEFL